MRVLVFHIARAYASAVYSGLSVVARQVDLQAFTLSVNDVFMVSAVLSLALAAIVWIARPVRRPVPAPVAVHAAPVAHKCWSTPRPIQH